MIAITPHAEGATLAVRAQPGARKNLVVGAHGDALKVAVSVPAEEGRANAALAEVLSSWLGLKRARIELVRGKTTRDKVFLVRGITAESLNALIASRLGESPCETKGPDA
jgi:uncharacterized protein (TIGR00251 family)